MTSDELGFTLFNEIGIINQLAGTAFERALPKGMTRAQFTVLNHFVRLGHHQRSPAQLASAFQVTRPTISSTLARMERSGLVAIEADPADGRAKLVSVTPNGLQMRERCLAAVSALLPLGLSAIDSHELPGLIEKLQRIRKILDAARD